MRTVRSLLHPVDLAELVEREYRIRPPVAATLLQRGFNDAYLVSGGDGERRVLRVYAKDKYWLASESDVQFELDLLDHLAAAGRSVAHPYPRRCGELLGRVDAPEGTRNYALFTFAPGRPLGAHPFDETLWGAIGSEIAELHQAMDTFVPKQSRYHLDLSILVDMPLAALEPYASGQEDSYAELSDLARRMKDAVSGPNWTPEAYGPVHADAHDGNIHVTAAGAITFFDFDHCGYGWRAYDLAPFYRPPSGGDEGRRTWAAVRAGYEKVRALSPSEQDALPVFSACRALWDVGDWLQAAAWTGDGWAHDDICTRTLTRVRTALAGTV